MNKVSVQLRQNNYKNDCTIIKITICCGSSCLICRWRIQNTTGKCPRRTREKWTSELLNFRLRNHFPGLQVERWFGTLVYLRLHNGFIFNRLYPNKKGIFLFLRKGNDKLVQSSNPRWRYNMSTCKSNRKCPISVAGIFIFQVINASYLGSDSIRNYPIEDFRVFHRTRREDWQSRSNWRWGF